ncbi:GTP diphosphokinase [Legionella sp. W05-934-2]|jgi:GTP pyrophosphokinase|uniref:GTP diphosphokinase n=1 Tax=Legionella sp. W05-934-2 TaxID=1198649 RepID=UPI003462F926
MVKVKEECEWIKDNQPDTQLWLKKLIRKGYIEDISLIENACALSEVAGRDQATDIGISCLHKGLLMADMLADLEVDQETLATAIIMDSVYYAELSLDVVEEQLGHVVCKLVNGINKMGDIANVQILNKAPENQQQLENTRKMLLAMVDDVRVVLIKLAERLCILRYCGQLPEGMCRQIASESMEIFAPLANRLGIGAIKWEMEDLAFRYLEPSAYKEIAKGLKTRRIERDQYVNKIVDELNEQIQLLDIHHFAVYGRSKHIHSIYRKMERKNVSLDEIYDATAVRVLVNTEAECYEVLSLVHSLWQQIPAEFDDYIINRKPNGYQSLHTAVIGPGDRVFEVQIRTFEMHDLAEMGVAAHWKYKEGGAEQKESHERKIEWLRDVLAWHRDLAKNKGVSEAIETEFLEDRVYVFSPDGDIFDLPQKSTPLDFAYHVHTMIGHRCRGAKVNGSIVPLTYQLKTGDQVEVLTGKEDKPSRDWLSPHSNYLRTSRAKAKVLHWFRMQDFDRNKAEGRELVDKELKALGIKFEALEELLDIYNYKRVDDLLAAIGRGDVKISQVVHRLSPDSIVSKPPQEIIKTHVKPEVSGGDLQIEGVGNLLTTMARCCQPLPGDTVIGYITMGRGVSIHRQDCSNILHLPEEYKRRLIQVSWGEKTRESYVVDISIKAFDRSGLLKDITAVLSNEKANVYSLNTQTNKEENLALITLTVEVDGLSKLSRLLNKIDQVPNVIESKRQV